VAQGRRMKRPVRPLDRIESSTIYGFPIKPLRRLARRCPVSRDGSFARLTPAWGEAVRAVIGAVLRRTQRRTALTR
jgi:hypothetical protein